MITPTVATLLAIGLACGLLTGSVARYRGHEFLSWFFFGSALFIIAFPMAIFTKVAGEPLPKKSGMLILAVGAGLSIPALTALYVAFSPVTLPSCDGLGVESDVKNVVASSPAGKNSGVVIIHLGNIQEVSKTETELRCTAKAKLNTATDVDLNYRLYIEDNELFVEVSWPPASNG